ncbi:hypothetical protein CDL12_16347 [Handroanthus impetiginosus]|uniref:Uncharacterized protein n=1 Tax=Handroanthus impetiginosus TaxID=429701 RepID=A0A2G9H0L9_9LAMI|nr:hypothetical protein CDL12_16347 [Handroanthus impetiginosus]
MITWSILVEEESKSYIIKLSWNTLEIGTKKARRKYSQNMFQIGYFSNHELRTKHMFESRYLYKFFPSKSSRFLGS